MAIFLRNQYSPAVLAELEAIRLGKTVSAGSTTITPATVKSAPPSTGSKLSDLNKYVNSNANPRVPNAPLASTSAGGSTASANRRTYLTKSRREITPYKPKAPFRDTRITTPYKKESLFDFLSRIPFLLATRRGAAGTPAPTSAERTTHVSIPEMQARLNAIPAESRSVSPRDVAMAPRVDQSSPTLYTGPVAASLARAAAPFDPMKSEGLQTEATDTGPSAFSVIMFATFALFGAAFVFRGR